MEKQETTHETPDCLQSELNDLLSDFSQGVCEDGPAILKDGEQMTIEEIIFELRCGNRAQIVLRPRIWDRSINDLWHTNLPDVIKSFDALRQWVFGTENYRVQADHPILARPDKIGLSKDEADAYAVELSRLGYENITIDTYRQRQDQERAMPQYIKCHKCNKDGATLDVCRCADESESDESADYVPKPVQMALRRAIILIHHKDDYFGGMDIIARLAGLSINKIDCEPATIAELIKI